MGPVSYTRAPAKALLSDLTVRTMHPVLPSSTQGFCSAGLSCIIAQTLPINRVHACIPRPHTQICFPVQSATSCLMMDLSGQVHIHIKPSLHCRLHTDKICTLFWFPKYWTPTPESKYFRTVFSLLQLSCLPSSICCSLISVSKCPPQLVPLPLLSRHVASSSQVTAFCAC